jgi:hypothetical protein
MQENQQVVFMSDGGEDVRQVQEYLHPNSEHLIDWFHITMRLTVLQQQTKSLQADRPDDGSAASKQIESIKHLLWHGNVDEALDRIDNLFMDLDLISRQSAPADKLAAGLSDLRTYIGNNRGSIPNYGERYRQGETISTAFVESTINQVVSCRFVKKQQMQWTLKGAHLLLQTRTKVLNNEIGGRVPALVPPVSPQGSNAQFRAEGRLTPRVSGALDSFYLLVKLHGAPRMPDKPTCRSRRSVPPPSNGRQRRGNPNFQIIR